MTPPRLGRKHLIFGAVLTAIGLVLVVDALSTWNIIVHTVGSTTWTTRNSWFFRESDPGVEWVCGLLAVAVAVVWVGGSVGWWIVRTIIQWWLHQTWKDSNLR